MNKKHSSLLISLPDKQTKFQETLKLNNSFFCIEIRIDEKNEKEQEERREREEVTTKTTKGRVRLQSDLIHD